MSQKGSPKGQKKGFVHTVRFEGDEDAKEHQLFVGQKNHLRQGKLYENFCVLNQDFLKYIMSINLTKRDYQILMFLLANMDFENKIIIDAEMIEYNLGVNRTHVNKYIRKLADLGIIKKRNLGYKNGTEVSLNFNTMSPHMAFKNKNNKENVSTHQQLMAIDHPYIKQQNVFTNQIDYVNADTGEVFHTETKK